MFGLPRITKNKEQGPKVEVMGVDRAIERFENDDEIIQACTGLSAILYYQSRDRATGDSQAASREQQNLVSLLANKGVSLEESDLNQFVSALSQVEA